MGIFVGNLAFEITEEQLSGAFEEYGSVKQVKIPLDRDTGKPRGFGFVNMETEAEESTAIEELDGAEWMGRSLRVNKARPRTEKSPRKTW